ncbi:hypothetical protein [Roseomonas populi]|uniref:Uncharacterized protein n=1 Tax=Roseomonas populi TaxID=3121582 RepID=A0ABT1X112_9PROT|nr:hypothetical protein [Roseomonas pecuniae]MCR0981795.1 hypothetical protein [Roseomonas pecuniae]
MSKPKTLRVVPLTNIMTSASERHEEGVAFDLETSEAENLIALGQVVEVEKEEVPEGAPVEVLPAPEPEPVPEEPAPEPIQVELPPPEPEPPAATPAPRGGRKAKA